MRKKMKCINPECDSETVRVTYGYRSDAFYSRHKIPIYECIKCHERWEGEGGLNEDEVDER